MHRWFDNDMKSPTIQVDRIVYMFVMAGNGQFQIKLVRLSYVLRKKYSAMVLTDEFANVFSSKM